jgi:DNA primase
VIPESFKQELLSRVDIVDVVDARVPLKKAGANWKACCPFHVEKSPSFIVSQARQTYHCFGCGVHGNAIGFLMEYAGLGYIDALRELADAAGMKLPEMQRDGAQRSEAPAPDLFDHMARAARFYKDSLKATPRAIEYLKGRGLTGEVAARFGIGYAPDGWQSLQRVFTDYDAKALVECGLVIVNDAGRRYDRFRDRIMFPITNQRGQVIGFGGRVLGQGEPKYLNSPETPLFEKGRELYGLRPAREGIRRTGRALVVEGYMDVVALAQHGVDNAVATLGTATTSTHVLKLLRQAEQIVFCFDGDAAGRKAAWHALGVTLESIPDGKIARFLFLPPEHDPDSYVREHGADAFAALADAAEPLSAYLLAELARRNDVRTAEGRSKLVADAKPLIEKMPARALQLQLVNEIAVVSGMTPPDVMRLYGLGGGGGGSRSGGGGSGERRFEPRSAFREPQSPGPQARAPLADGRLERELLRAVLAHPQLAADVPIELLDAGRPVADALIAVIDYVSEHGAAVAALAENFADGPHAVQILPIARELVDAMPTSEAAVADLRGAVAQLEIRRLQAECKVLNQKEKNGGLTDLDKVHYRELLQRERELKESLRGGSPVL